MIWPWGPGKPLKIPSFRKRHGVKGAVISEVDLIKGIGRCAGMMVADVPGATGYYDTNYEGMAEHALKALASNGLVYVHVEAPDEAGHAGDYEAKIRAIENLDRRLLGKILDGLEGDYTVSILPDHPTPVEVKTHTSEPVPFAVYSTAGRKDGVAIFDEFAARKGDYGLLEGEKFIERILRGDRLKRGR
jgi:2,3-bisphosphoglycerate-independent phosphoglycerate mutase